MCRSIGWILDTTLGQVWGASYNSCCVITDNSFALSDSETTYRHVNALSNAVSVGNISLHAGAFMNNGSGTTYRAALADGLDTSEMKQLKVHSKIGMLMHLSWMS